MVDSEINGSNSSRERGARRSKAFSENALGNISITDFRGVANAPTKIRGGGGGLEGTR